MRTLAIDSATESCSAALFEDSECLDSFYAVIGRGHAERLVPAIAALPGKGRAERIVVSLGPGSFTGTRIGLAAARALGLAWGAQVFGYPTLALVAAMARGVGISPVSVCMSGGHGEWLVQDFGKDGLPEGQYRSLKPEAAAVAARHELVAGSQAEALVSLRDGGRAVALLPDAAHFPLLPVSLLTADLTPLYGRPPDARLPQASR